MTTVCFVTPPGEAPAEGLLGYETVRRALSPYDLERPYDNAVCVETVSLGSAVALVADLDWYLRRTVQDVLVKEPAVSDREWLSRTLAEALRAEAIEPADTPEVVKIYGVEEGRLIEPMYAERRRDGTLPGYDLREVEGTVVVRVSPEEFGR
ncbi:MAG: DUF5804 family protein [Halobacteriales archaeon]